MKKNTGNNPGVHAADEDIDFELTGGAQDGSQNGSDVAEEEETQERQNQLEDQEDYDGDWKEARTLLKAADDECSYSIDDYLERLAIDALKVRFNAKERTESLYNAIQNL